MLVYHDSIQATLEHQGPKNSVENQYWIWADNK